MTNPPTPSAPLKMSATFMPSGSSLMRAMPVYSLRLQAKRICQAGCVMTLYQAPSGSVSLQHDMPSGRV